MTTNIEQTKVSQHALDQFQAIQNMLKHKKPILFLDYDGTLTPIVSRPDLAVLSQQSRQIVEQVAAALPTAIISGRATDDVKNLVKINTIYYAGNHGFDMEGPNLKHQLASEFIPDVHRVYCRIEEKLKDVPGCIIENKIFSLSVHYRLVESEKDEKKIFDTVKAIVEREERVKLTFGKKVIEVRPRVEWNKGKAVIHLLHLFQSQLKIEDSIPIYIGDDRTDEDAFDAVKSFGIGILVADNRNDERLNQNSPNKTNAKFYVNGVDEALKFLLKLSIKPSHV